MAINTPEELLNRVAACMNNKDLDAFVSLYEPEVVLLMKLDQTLMDLRELEKK